MSISDRSTLWESFQDLQKNHVAEWSAILTTPVGLQTSSLNLPNPASTLTPFLILPIELRMNIYAYLLEADISNIRSLKSVSRQLYLEVSPLHYADYVPRIECWGFDGLEQEHPTYSDPYIPATDPVSLLVKRLKRSIGWWTPREQPEPMDANEVFYYRVHSGGPRNLAWVLEMPLMARRHIRHLQVFGPVPEEACNVLGPPPRWVRGLPIGEGLGEWYAPERAILKWIRANMSNVISFDYCFILGTLYNSHGRDGTRILDDIFGAEKTPPCRKLIIPRSMLSQTMRSWVDPITTALRSGSPLRHLELWIIPSLADVLLGRRRSWTYPPDEVMLISEISAFRAIPDLDSVRLFVYAAPEYVYDLDFRRRYRVGAMASRQVNPPQEIYVDLDVEGHRAMVYTEMEDVDGCRRPRLGSPVNFI